jgi:hypothetical protein
MENFYSLNGVQVEKYLAHFLSAGDLWDGLCDGGSEHDGFSL